MRLELLLQLAIGPEDRDHGQDHADLVDNLQPQGSPVRVAAAEAVHIGALGNVGKDRNQDRDDGVLKDDEPRPLVPVGSLGGALGRLCAHGPHGGEEDVAAVVGLGGEEAADEEEEVGDGDGLGRVEPGPQVDVGGGRADFYKATNGVDWDEEAYPQNVGLLLRLARVEGVSGHEY